MFGLGRNTHAEYAVLGSWAHKPASVDWAVAAGAGVVAEAAERALRLLSVKGRQHGLYRRWCWRGRLCRVTQIARARGATVIASARRPTRTISAKSAPSCGLRRGNGGPQALDVDKIDAVLDAVGQTRLRN